MNKIIISFVIILMGYSCNTHNDINNKKRKEALKLNDQAVELTNQIYNKFDNDSIFDKDSILNASLVLLEKSILLDSTLKMPYINKVNRLVQLKKYNEAIRWIDTIKSRFPSNQEIVIFQGFLYEKVGYIDSANIIYNKVKKIFSNKLLLEPNDITIQLKIIELDYYLTNDKKNAISKLNDLNSKQPQNKEIQNMIELLKLFDKNEYINKDI